MHVWLVLSADGLTKVNTVDGCVSSHIRRCRFINMCRAAVRRCSQLMNRRRKFHLWTTDPVRITHLFIDQCRLLTDVPAVATLNSTF